MSRPARAVVTAVPIVLVVAYAAIPGWNSLGSDVFNAYTLTAASCMAALLVAVSVQRPDPAWPWVLIIVAEATWIIGDVVYDVIGTPTTSVADLFYIVGYVSLVLAVLGFVRMRTRQLDVDSLIDTAMIGIAGGLAIWELIIEPASRTHAGGAIDHAVAGVYPVLDVLLVMMLVQLLLTPGRKPPAAVLLLCGVALIAIADTGYAALQQTDAYGTDTLSEALDTMWLAGYALLPLAALHPSMRELTRRSGGDVSSRTGLLVAGAAFVALPLIHLVAQAVGHDPPTEALALAILTICPLVLWRIARLNRATSNAREQVSKQHAYYRAVAVNSSDVFLVVDRDGLVTDASGALGSLAGYAPSDAVGTDALSAVVPEHRERARHLLDTALARPGMTVHAEVRIITSNGAGLWVQLRCTNLLDDPSVAGIVVNAHDISDRKQVETELEYQAFHDTLTGLANRALLRDRIEHALALRTREGHSVAIIYCDLDGFKFVNDSLGHDAGDELLGHVARRISDAVRPGDTVSRLGGDEFAVLLEGATDLSAEASEVGARVLAAVRQPVEIGGTKFAVTASLGVAIADRAATTSADDLLRDADSAMYRAKDSGRNTLVRFERGMRAASLNRLHLDADLHGAAERGELIVHYQPFVDLVTGRITGFEALVRWLHPTRGLLSPADFVALAEENGTIVEIGEHVLNEACRAGGRWQRSVGSPVVVAVNLSARQLASPDFVDTVATALERHGLEASSLMLELTESLIGEHPDEIARSLRALKGLGIRIAIDDFGVGYSSLSHLRQFPIDVLKLDRSFVESIVREKDLPAIVQAVLELAQTLELQTIAEGISTRVQRNALARAGCELGQGFLFRRPVSQDVAEGLLRGQPFITSTAGAPVGTLIDQATGASPAS
jgi:diguanylate cyclase (GGDEF)-like protein/PAS domain S-box-containing protein